MAFVMSEQSRAIIKNKETTAYSYYYVLFVQNYIEI